MGRKNVNIHETVTFGTRFLLKCSAIVLLDNWLLDIFFIALSTNAEIYIACKISEFPD